MNHVNARKKLAAGALVALMLSAGPALADMSEKEMLRELKKIIEQQQLQLNKQAAQIKELEKMITNGAPATPTETASTEKKAEDATIIHSAQKNVAVGVYGQINRAVVVADNGSTNKTYFADNSNSSSRMGLNVKAEVNDELTVGGKIEYEFRSTRSASINELDTTGDNSLYLRHADVYFNTGKFGKVSLGQGSMAADGISGLDLSGTNVVTNVAVNDMAGGHYWFDGVNPVVDGGLQIRNVFGDLDGSREDRIRYDTPSMMGFSASASAATDEMYNAALRYSRQYDGARVVSGIGWQSPGDSAPVIDNRFNGAVSVLLDCGFNITLAGGFDDSSADNEATFWYSKLGYRAAFLPIGKTSFSIDYGQFDEFNVLDGDASVWSAAFVQDWADYGTELYLAFRQYSYETADTDYDDIDIIMGGGRVKF